MEHGTHNLIFNHFITLMWVRYVRDTRSHYDCLLGKSWCFVVPMEVCYPYTPSRWDILPQFLGVLSVHSPFRNNSATESCLTPGRTLLWTANIQWLIEAEVSRGPLWHNVDKTSAGNFNSPWGWLGLSGLHHSSTASSNKSCFFPLPFIDIDVKGAATQISGTLTSSSVSASCRTKIIITYQWAVAFIESWCSSQNFYIYILKHRLKQKTINTRMALCWHGLLTEIKTI